MKLTNVFFRNTSINHFTVIHYAGQVSYNIDGWVEKNRDLVDQSILEVLSASDHPLIAQLFTPGQLHFIKTKYFKTENLGENVNFSFIIYS